MPKTATNNNKNKPKLPRKGIVPGLGLDEIGVPQASIGTAEPLSVKDYQKVAKEEAQYELSKAQSNLLALIQDYEALYNEQVIPILNRENQSVTVFRGVKYITVRDCDVAQGISTGTTQIPADKCNGDCPSCEYKACLRAIKAADTDNECDGECGSCSQSCEFDIKAGHSDKLLDIFKDYDIDD